jgi:hypothetical protein
MLQERLRGCEWQRDHSLGSLHAYFTGEPDAHAAPLNASVRAAGWWCAGVRDVYAVLVGPFELAPDLWVGVEALLQPPSDAGIDAFLGDGVLAAPGATPNVTEAVPSDTLHVHHMHVKELDDVSSHRFETHGDYYDVRGAGYERPFRGADACNVRPRLPVRPTPATPRGFSARSGLLGLVLGDRSVDARGYLHLGALLNSEGGARVPPFYVRVAFGLRPLARCRRADKLLLFHAMLGGARADPYWRYAVESPRAVAFWWRGRFPASGRVVDAWRHSHRSRDAGLLLLRGHRAPNASDWAPPAAAGASLPAWAADPRDDAAWARQLRERVAARAAAEGALLLASGPAEQFDGAQSLREFDVRAGERYTVLALHAAGAAPFRAHSLVFLRLFPADAPAGASRMDDVAACAWAARAQAGSLRWRECADDLRAPSCAHGAEPPGVASAERCAERGWFF